jgi:hypothetical protein
MTSYFGICVLVMDLESLDIETMTHNEGNATPGLETVEIVSDESHTKQFSPIAVKLLEEALNRGVTGKLNHADERKLIARRLNVEVHRITVPTVVESFLLTL